MDAGRWPHGPGADGLPVPRAAKARCKACATVWLALPDEDVIELDMPIGPPPARGPGPANHAPTPAARPQDMGEDAAEEEESESPRRRRWPWLLLLLVLLALTAAAAALFGLWKPERFGLPSAEAAAQSMGLALPPLTLPRLGLPPLSMPHISMPHISMPSVRVPESRVPPLSVSVDSVKRPLAGGGVVWEVTGQLGNPGKSTQPVPPLEMVLLAADGTEIDRWIIRASADTLPPGGTVSFETSAVNPPPQAVRLAVRLKPASLARL